MSGGVPRGRHTTARGRIASALWPMSLAISNVDCPVALLPRRAEKPYVKHASRDECPDYRA
jgi:hypothetical protein